MIGSTMARPVPGLGHIDGIAYYLAFTFRDGEMRLLIFVHGVNLFGVR
jgi:hypothetical protein